MKRIMAALLALCLLVCMGALALADEQKPASCGIDGHYKGDGLVHTRPEICWITGHYECDGLTHERAACKIHLHYVCDGRDHSAASCGAEGHAVCDWREHGTPDCGIAGHCISDDLRHKQASCGVAGHYTCDGMDHGEAACGKDGHGSCDGLDHSRAACGTKGHYVCDGLVHEAAACGRAQHCTTDGLAHEAADCGIAGHMTCDGKNHEPAACGIAGHYACAGGYHYAKLVSKYCNAAPQHVVCEGNPEHFCDLAYGGCGDTYVCSRSNAHTACRMCGLLWCDYSLGGHETPCGNANHRPCVYTMKGKRYVKAEHDICGYCGDFVCNGEKHGNTKCVPACKYCGYPEKMHEKHLYECGKHYWCKVEGEHGECECGKSYVCNKKHTCEAE